MYGWMGGLSEMEPDGLKKKGETDFRGFNPICCICKLHKKTVLCFIKDVMCNTKPDIIYKE